MDQRTDIFTSDLMKQYALLAYCFENHSGFCSPLYAFNLLWCTTLNLPFGFNCIL